MRVVLDTNCLVSAIGWGGSPYKVLRACLNNQLELYTSPALLDELTRVLSRPRLAVVASHPDLPVVLAWLHDSARVVFPQVKVDIVKEDLDDHRVIECALAAQASAVITGDDHLLALGNYQGIVFCSPREACDRWGLG